MDLWRATLIHFKDIYTEYEAEITEIAVADFHNLVDELLKPSTWPFFSAEKEETMHHYGIWDYEEWFADIASRDKGLRPETPRPPSAFGKERFVLHAFSGRRRFGDFQAYFDDLAKHFEGFTVYVLSADVILDEQIGNLRKNSTTEFWFRAMWARQIIAFLGGPPCNTFSQVRRQELGSASSHRGPRPVRGPNSPWGLQSLRLGELEFVEAGNALLGFSVASMYIMAIQGGCGAPEHPGDPNDEETTKITIWRLPIIAALLRCEGVALHSFMQGYYGSETPKPTNILAVNLDAFGAQLLRWRITDKLPCGQSTGKDMNGFYHTAKLKEYAPALGACLANSFAQAITKVPVDPAAADAQGFVTATAQLRDSTRGSCIGHDHHG